MANAATSTPQHAAPAPAGAATLPTKMLLRIVTPSRQLMSELIDEVQVPGKAGYLGILPGHAPLLSELRVGELIYRQGATQHRLLITGGFLEVLPGQVTILAEAAERPEEIDVARAEAARERAENRLRSANSETDLDRASVALARALVRLRLAGKG